MAEPIYKDFDLSLRRHPLTGDIATTTDESAIKIALKNLMRLAPYDKPFNPEIASPLYEFLFDPIDVATSVLMRINLKYLIVQYEPRIDDIVIQVNPVQEENKYDVIVEYTVKKTNSRQSLSLFLPVERLK